MSTLLSCLSLIPRCRWREEVFTPTRARITSGTRLARAIALPDQPSLSTHAPRQPAARPASTERRTCPWPPARYNTGGGSALPKIRIGLHKRFVHCFGDCAIVNPILGGQHLLYCTPFRCIFQSIAQYMASPRRPPVLPFNIQYWYRYHHQYRGKAKPQYRRGPYPSRTRVRVNPISINQSKVLTSHTRARRSHIPAPPQREAKPASLSDAGLGELWPLQDGTDYGRGCDLLRGTRRRASRPGL